MITSASIHKAIWTAWYTHIDASFIQYWDDEQKQSFVSLNDGEAAPGTPFPYCVLESLEPYPMARMTGSFNETGKRQLQKVPLRFNVYCNSLSDGRSAKLACSALAETIMLIYGGGNAVPVALVDDGNGSIVNVQYQNDFGLRLGDNEHQWMISYVIDHDFPYR